MLIEQIHYATTSRYNFPRFLEISGLPERFVELSLSSMGEVREKSFQPWLNFVDSSIAKVEEYEGIVEVYSGEGISLISPLEPIPDATPIVAIDASSIKVGETEEGVICAVRGAVIWKEKSRYKYLRLGPFPFYITEENKKEILGLLKYYSSISFSPSMSFMIEIQNRLCEALERWIQMTISASISDSIILLDGSLTSRTSNFRPNILERILKNARDNSNIVLSFSKASTIKFLGKKITDLIIRRKETCLLEIDERMLSISSRRRLRLLGKIYVTKLNKRGYPFRVDIDKILPREIQIMAVQRLLGNELAFQGYPETLRLAHIFSTFTASDVIGIQRFIAREYGLKVVTWPSIRKALFGPFGTGNVGD